MELLRLVTSAKLGNTQAFDALVRLCQRKVLGVARAIVGDEASAEDATQVAFLTAWQRLEDLREAEAFPGWVAAIARNEALGICRRRGREGTCVELDPDLHDERLGSAELSGHLPPAWASLTRGLRPAQVTLLELKYAAGLSHAQIGSVLGLPEARVKSRLFTLRRHLLWAWGRTPPEPEVLLEEKIMTELETRMLGAHVFERLSLASQTLFARCTLASAEFAPDLLAELGQIDRGTEFLALYGTQPGLGELIGILNHTDRFTERRVIERLEVVEPATAEAIKQNMFVFEDIILCDRAAVALIVAHADQSLLATALVGTERRVKNHVLDALSEETQAPLQALLQAVDGDPLLVAAAQLTMVNLIRDLDQAGRLKIVRPAEAEGPGAWPVITVA